MIFWLLLGPFIDEGGLWEELGWRGFAAPVLLARLRSPLTSTLVLGALWWFWHFPREVPNLISGLPVGGWAGWFYGQFLFLVLCLALSVVIAPAWFRTGGSVLPAILIHGFTNVWSKALSAPVWATLGTDVRTWLVIAAAVLVLLVTKGRLGAGEPETWPPPPGVH